MTTTFWRWLAGVVAVLTLATGSTGAAAGLTPSATTTTAIQGWERYFRLEWTAQDKAGGRQIAGYIYNTYGTPAANVQVLAQGLDATGNVVGQKLEWVPGIVPALNRSYFIVAGLPPANAYRVSVWAFDLVQGGNDQRR